MNLNAHGTHYKTYEYYHHRVASCYSYVAPVILALFLLVLLCRDRRVAAAADAAAVAVDCCYLRRMIEIEMDVCP